MNKTKIGGFIARCRKEKQITQEQLADLLSVTNKAVSKWETGSCLPDASLYEPLCGILDITVDELFAGTRSTGAERQLAQMLKRRLYNLSDKCLSFSEFDNALSRVSELTTILKAFGSKDEAVAFLVRETSCPADECAAAYDFYTGMFPPEEGEKAE